MHNCTLETNHTSCYLIIIIFISQNGENAKREIDHLLRVNPTGIAANKAINYYFYLGQRSLIKEK